MRFIHLGVSLRLRKWISFQVEKKKPLYFTDEPLIMVQVASYNASGTIEAALQSLMHQTYKNWIAVVYDDGSTDNTPELLPEIASRDQRIKVVLSNVNSGINVARNEILKQSKQIPWVIMTVLDSDDVAEPYFLADGLGLLQKGASAVRCWNERWDSEFSKKQYSFLACAQVFVRRKEANLLGFYRLKPYTADDDYMERLEKLIVLQGGVMCHSIRSLQKMRIHANNLSRSKGTVARVKFERTSRKMSRAAFRVNKLHVPESNR